MKHGAREVDHGKWRRLEIGDLTGTDDQPSVIDQTAVEIIKHSVDLPWDKIHQHITAQDKVYGRSQVCRRRIVALHQVELSELHHLSDGGKNLVAAFPDLLEIAFFDPTWGAPEGPLGIDSRCSFFKEEPIDVRGKNRDVPIGEVRNHLMDEYGQRIGLFTCAATRAPDFKTPRSRPPCGNPFPKNMLFQDFKNSFFSEEVGFPNGEGTGENAKLLQVRWRSKECFNEGCGLRKMELLGSNGDASLKVSVTSLRKVQSEAPGYEFFQLSQEIP